MDTSLPDGRLDQRGERVLLRLQRAHRGLEVVELLLELCLVGGDRVLARGDLILQRLNPGVERVVLLGDEAAGGGRLRDEVGELGGDARDAVGAGQHGRHRSRIRRERLLELRRVEGERAVLLRGHAEAGKIHERAGAGDRARKHGVQPGDEVLGARVEREAADLERGLRLAVRLVRRRRALDLGDRRLLVDERHDRVEGAHQRLDVVGDRRLVVGDGDRGRARRLEAQRDVRDHVAEGVRLALERPAEPAHRELRVLAGLGRLDEQRRVVVHDRDRAARPRGGAAQHEPVVGARRRAEVPRRGGDAGAEPIDGAAERVEGGRRIDGDALDRPRAHLELEGAGAGGHRVGARGEPDARGGRRAVGELDDVQGHRAVLGAGTRRRGDHALVARGGALDEHAARRAERPRGRAERGEIAGERADRRLRRLDGGELVLEQRDRRARRGHELADDLVGVETGGETADRDQPRARHGVATPWRPRKRPRGRPLPGAPPARVRSRYPSSLSARFGSWFACASTAAPACWSTSLLARFALSAATSASRMRPSASWKFCCATWRFEIAVRSRLSTAPIEPRVCATCAMPEARLTSADCAAACVETAIWEAVTPRMPETDPSTLVKLIWEFAVLSSPICSVTVVPALSSCTPLKTVVAEMRSISESSAVNSCWIALRWASLTVPVAASVASSLSRVRMSVSVPSACSPTASAERPSLALRTACPATRWSRSSRSAIASPAASSDAWLMRRPEDSRRMAWLRPPCVLLRLNWAFNDATLVLMSSAMGPFPPWVSGPRASGPSLAAVRRTLSASAR